MSLFGRLFVPLDCLYSIDGNVPGLLRTTDETPHDRSRLVTICWHKDACISVQVKFNCCSSLRREWLGISISAAGRWTARRQAAALASILMIPLVDLRPHLNRTRAVHWWKFYQCSTWASSRWYSLAAGRQTAGSMAGCERRASCSCCCCTWCMLQMIMTSCSLSSEYRLYTGDRSSYLDRSFIWLWLSVQP